MKAAGPVFDAFSYHFYGTVSRRCTATLEPKAGMRAEEALSPDWFERNLTVEAFYAKLRDAYLPGKDLWLTETGEAACGGDPWAADFIDSFRYLDQLGSLAQKRVKTVMHNTLASSDYGFLDEETLEPRPNYWAALLWKRTMGSRVLDPGIKSTATLRVFAQCMKDSKGGVSVLVMNLDRRSEQSLEVPLAAERYTLSAPELLSRTVSLNGEAMKVAEDGTLPAIKGLRVGAGKLVLPPLTITFVTIPGAQNPSCK
jgi:heparanase 1